MAQALFRAIVKSSTGMLTSTPFGAVSETDPVPVWMFSSISNVTVVHGTTPLPSGLELAACIAGPVESALIVNLYAAKPEILFPAASVTAPFGTITE